MGKAKIGRPKRFGTQLDARSTPHHKRLLQHWARQDGTSISTIVGELIAREDLRRRGVISVLINDHEAFTKAFEARK